MAYIGNEPAALVTELDNGVVTTTKLANDAVTAAKIVDGTIVADDLATGIITNATVAANAAIAATKIAISGGSNITLQSDGTFDLDAAVDVTGSYSVNGNAVIDSSRNITAGGYIQANGNISTGGAGRLRAGASNQLQLYFDGAHGHLANSTGNFTVDVAGDIILDAAGNDVIFKDAGTTFGQITNDSGNMIIYNAGSQMLKGVGGGANAQFVGSVGIGSAPQSFSALQVKAATDQHVAVFTNSAGLTIGGITDAGGSAGLRLAGAPLHFSGSGGGASSGPHLVIDTSGNATFSGTLTTNGLTRINAASGHSQSALLDLYGTNGGGFGGSVIARSRVESVTAGGAYNADMKFYTTDDSNNLDLVLTLDHDQNATFTGKAIVGAGSSSAPSITGSNDTDAGLFWGGGFLGFTGGSANYMRLNDNGDLLHGSQSDTTLYNNTSGGGINLMASNRLDVARAGDVVATFNRTTNAGQVIQLYQAGSLAGGLGVSGTDATIGTGDTGITFEDAANAVHPVNFTTGAARDNAVDLGKSAARFRNLHLSGEAKANDRFLTSNMFIGTVPSTINNNTGLVILFDLTNSSANNIGHQFSGSIIGNSYTGQAFVNVNIVKHYSTDAVAYDVADDQNLNSVVSRMQLQLVTATYGGTSYLGILKAGGGTGTISLNGYFSGSNTDVIERAAGTFTVTTTHANLNF